MIYRCNLSVHFTCETLRSLICHLGRVHKNDNGFHVLCGIGGCARTYTNFFSLRNHFVRKHSEILNGERQGLPGDLAHQNNANGYQDGAENDDNDNALGHQPFNFEREVEVYKKTNVLCLMQIKDEGKIPQTVVDSVVRNTTQIVDNSVELLKSGLEQCLNNAGLRKEDIPGVTELFDDASKIRKPFEGCHNEASQLQYYKNNLGLVVRY